MIQIPFISLLNTVMHFDFIEYLPDYEDINMTLAREYVRRAALWAQALDCREHWPFFDAVRRMDPGFELREVTAKALRDRLEKTVGARMILLMEAAIRWEAYRGEARATLPDLPDLYAPAVAMYLHHGSIHAEHHMILTPINGFRKEPFETYLMHAPYMDAAAVNALLTPPPALPVTTFTFTKGWSRSHKRPLALIDFETARATHEAGDGYIVLAGDRVDRPVAFLEIGPRTGMIGVTFLDVHLRCHLQYAFKRHGERYFMQSADYRTYDGTTDTVVMMESYRFTPEGGLVIYVNDVLDQMTTTRTAVDPVDVSRNWEDAPVFGQYAGFVRKER